jgi:hypothetical protein
MTDQKKNTLKKSEANWNKTVIGHDAIVYKKYLDPIIVDAMPSENNTFISVTLSKLVSIRVRQGFSKLVSKISFTE